jgi:hypothetical protein
MEDNLQRFVTEHRAGFDVQEPPAGLWNRIEPALQPAKTRRTPVFKMLWLKAAAAAMIVFLAGTGAYYLLKKNTPAAAGPVAAALPDSTSKEQGPDTNGIASLAPGQAGQVYQFASLIETKKNELKAMAGGQPELYRRFESDFYQLDSSYQVLKEQLSLSPDREVLLEALIINLEMQLQVLNKQLDVIQEIKNSKNKKDENIYNKTI